MVFDLSSLRSALSPSGGVAYHYIAYKYQRTLWKPFIRSVEGWLSHWEPGKKKLLIIGSSGGYCLTDSFFKRFEKIECLDPDPIAQWVLTRRLGKLPLQEFRWNRKNYFSGSKDSPFGERFFQFLETKQDYAVLFSNFLGQLSLLERAQEFAPGSPEEMRWNVFVDQLGKGLRKRGAWASYHDRVSGPIRPKIVQPLRKQVQTDEELLHCFYPEACGTSSESPIELIDHMTAGYFPGQDASYFSWEIYSGHFHLIEGQHS